jgi:hypothetical protein
VRRKLSARMRRRQEQVTLASSHAEDRVVRGPGNSFLYLPAKALVSSEPLSRNS